MQLGCTPKLQEFLKKDILLADQSMDPFYIWNASIMLVKRRKTIVVLHAQSPNWTILFWMGYAAC